MQESIWKICFQYPSNTLNVCQSIYHTVLILHMYMYRLHVHNIMLMPTLCGRGPEPDGKSTIQVRLGWE